MGAAWQDILVGAAAVAAAWWLVADRIRRRRAGARCASCALAEAARGSDPAARGGRRSA